MSGRVIEHEGGRYYSPGPEHAFSIGALDGTLVYGCSCGEAVFSVPDDVNINPNTGGPWLDPLSRDPIGPPNVLCHEE